MGIISLHSHQKSACHLHVRDEVTDTEVKWPPNLIGLRIWNSEAAASYKKDARAEITGMVSL